MQPEASNNRCKYSQLLVVAEPALSDSRTSVSPANPTLNHSYGRCELARSHLTNVVATPLWGVCCVWSNTSGMAHSAVATPRRRLSWEADWLIWGAHAPSRAGDGAFAIANFLGSQSIAARRRNEHARRVRSPGKGRIEFPDTWLCLAIIAIILCSVIETHAQEPTPTPQTVGQPGVTIEEVIVTGSNIPTAEEVTPQPVYLLNRDEIFRLGVRNATDLVQMLPTVSGPSINENVNTLSNGQTEVDLRGLGPKETLVLQDGRRLAPNGFARYTVQLNSFFGGAVDLNLFPIGLIDHIDVLEDGASAIYGADAVAGVFNVWLIHRFQTCRSLL